jgi:hypothetical protein
MIAGELFQKGGVKPGIIKYNNRTGQKDVLSVQLLSVDNKRLFFHNLNAWAKEFIDRFPNEKDIMLHKALWSYYVIKPAEKASPLYKINHSVSLILLSGLDLEGVAVLDFSGKCLSTCLSFIGLAPWNLCGETTSPKYSGLSNDLMKYSMLIALKAAKGVSDRTNIFTSMFISDRGKKFVIRLFGEASVYNVNDIKFIVNRRGVKAFLAGNTKVFRKNAEKHEMPPLGDPPLYI